MDDDLYAAFEETHRGSRDLIKSRLKHYLPFVSPLKELYPNATAIDLGCGRGEWLELLDEYGFSARGVDLDEGMLKACTALNLTVEVKDALAYLKSLPNESMVTISAFHLIEHISFDQLKYLVKEAYRVLKPAGIFILETPNPDNIVVGTSSFYLDPTHLRPIPSGLLEFLVKHFGFERVKTLRLQEPLSVYNDEISLLDVLAGVSPDYSIVSQKMADEDMLKAFEKPFEAEYGVTLEMLATKYQAQIERIETRSEGLVRQIEAQLHAKYQTQIERIETRFECIETRFECIETRSEELIRQIEAQLHAMYDSSSWRITAPLRYMAKTVKVIKSNILGKRT